MRQGGETSHLVGLYGVVQLLGPHPQGISSRLPITHPARHWRCTSALHKSSLIFHTSPATIPPYHPPSGAHHVLHEHVGSEVSASGRDGVQSVRVVLHQVHEHVVQRILESGWWRGATVGAAPGMGRVEGELPHEGALYVAKGGVILVQITRVDHPGVEERSRGIIPAK